MRNEQVIVCPNCSTEIKLTESLAMPLIQTVRKEYEVKIAEKDAGIAKRETEVREREKAVKDAQKAIDEQVTEKLKSVRAQITEEEAKKAKLAAVSELDAKAKKLIELQEVLKQRNAKLEEAQKAQAELLRKERELEDAQRELELTVEKRVQASLAVIRKKAQQKAEDSLKLKVSEKEVQIASMQRKIEELKRKAEQGSQQIQGEVLELELEETLRVKFPFDSIEPVGKGEYGGDILQHVVSPIGQASGSILWESKRTKSWRDGWLPKLRNDQRTAKAEIAILISETLPKEIETFGLYEGIWVSAPRYTVPLVIALRQSLIDIANVKRVQEGQQTKMELIYEYLTSPRFRHRVEAIVEKFSDMQSDLDRERKSMTRLWAKRESQIQGAIESTVGMYGDLQGIAGRALQEIEGLETPLLESDLIDTED